MPTSTEALTVATGSSRRLALMLAMAMFVLVVDTSLMNVSISAIVDDLDTTVSSVQATIALEALVSASFILINSRVADLIGRKRAFLIGLALYGIGALTMTVAQNMTMVVVFWALLGGIGASLLLPAMQSLIHGNFEPDVQPKVYALVGASAAIAAAIGPLIGGFITTYLSWRVGFLLEALVIVGVLFNAKLIKDVPYTGPRDIDLVGAILSILGMGGLVLGILVWQEGGESVVALVMVGLIGFASLVYWLLRRDKAGLPALLDIDLFKSAYFRLGVSSQLLQQLALGGAMIALPIFFQMVLEYNAMESGLAIAPLSLSMFVIAMMAGKRAGKRRTSRVIRAGFGLLTLGTLVLIWVVPRGDSGRDFIIPLIIMGSGLGLLVSQLNNYTLAPISDDLISEAAGVNSAAGQFGLSVGLALAGAIMLATLSWSFLDLANDSEVLTPAEQTQVAEALEHDAQVMSNTQLEELTQDARPEAQDEIVKINSDARPLALQFALAVPLIAGILGFLLSLRMQQLPDSVEGVRSDMLAL